MKITVNGQPLDTEAQTLSVLLDQQGFGGRTVATALNGSFVAAGLRMDQALVPGDAVEILAPMQGG